MPQLIVEYSDNIKQLDENKLLLTLNQHLIETGIVTAQDLKSRIHADTSFLIGLGDQPQAYIHVHLYILAGRDLAQKKTLGDQAIAALRGFKDFQAHGLELQLSVQMTDMPRDDYRKDVVQF